MDVTSIAIILLAIGVLGTGVYFQLTGKKDLAKGLFVMVGGILVLLGVMNKEKLNKIKQKGQTAIDDSKKNDDVRDDTVKNIDDQIKENKDTINEINKILDD